MIYKQTELHNVEEMVPIEGRPGVLLQRVPESVRAGLRELGSQQIRRAAAIEIRFSAPAGSEASVTLASYGGISKVQVYYGDYWVEDQELGEEPKTIAMKELEPGFQFQFPWKERVPRASFGPVWRVVLQGYEVHLLDIRGEGLQPPEAEEKPAFTYLAYGTSITFGISAATPDLTYVSQAAWRLGLDAVNLGMPGAAYCETSVAEHIAGRNDWDIASLCVSVNMLNQGVPAREFGEKAEAMVRKIASAHPDKPLVCIGLFPCFADFGWTWPGRDAQAGSEAYRRTLKEIAEGCGYPNVHYADGRDLLNDWRGLSHDLLHPGNAGMIRIGERLAERMRPLLGE
jgi:lysophospholipase L1-like esterase